MKATDALFFLISLGGFGLAIIGGISTIIYGQKEIGILTLTLSPFFAGLSYMWFSMLKTS